MPLNLLIVIAGVFVTTALLSGSGPAPAVRADTREAPARELEQTARCRRSADPSG
jgi:hypothetical protein